LADITFTRSGNLTQQCDLAGTLQGNLSATDFITSGFTTFTATAFTLTIPANQASKTCTIVPAFDSLLENIESLLLTVISATNGCYVRNTTTLVTFTDDDVKTIQRIVVAGKKLVGAPPLGSSADGYLGLDGRLSFVAPNVQAFNNFISSAWQDGTRSLLEFDVSILSPASPGWRLEYYLVSTSYFRVAWANGIFTVTVPGAAFSWNITYPADREGKATFQFLLQGGRFQCFFNGALAFTDSYTITSNATTASAFMVFETRSGQFSTSGLKIRTGSFDWEPGVFNA
jgi:hypothetical protein